MYVCIYIYVCVYAINITINKPKNNKIINNKQPRHTQQTTKTIGKNNNSSQFFIILTTYLKECDDKQLSYLGGLNTD